MNAITFQLELLEPVLATMPQSGEENSAMAYDFIPGSMVRGALIAAFARQRGTDDLMADEDARALFFGSVMYLNAYPFHASSENPRMLPTPFSWRVEKKEARSEPMPIWDLAVSEKRLDQPEAVKQAFVTGGTEAERYFYTPAHQVNVHNASADRNMKRASSSTVFRYDALASGEWFAGAIVSADVSALETLMKLLPEELSIGGSHTAGYGRVAVHALELKSDWHEAETADANKQVVLTLLSDTIVRGAKGKQGDLNVALELALGLDTPPEPAAVFRKVRVVGGFNRKAGLPLAQEWALQAGSVFVYKAEALRGKSGLETLARFGIGERRREGFGRVAVNWQMREACVGRMLSSLSLRLDQMARSGGMIPEMTEESRAFAKRMATRQLRTQLERELAHLINRAEWKKLPQNAQLSRVRTAAQQAWNQVNASGADDGLPAVRTLLEELKGARSQFQAARVGGESLENWLTRLAAKENHFRREFGLGAELPMVAKEPADLDPRLRAEFTARWIDGVMQKGMRQNRRADAKEGS